MSERKAPGPGVLTLGLLTGAVAVLIGVGLLTRAETPFGRVWAGGLALLGVIVAVSWLTNGRRRTPEPARDAVLDGEPAHVRPRSVPAGPMLFVTGALAAWCAVVAVVGAATESWLWLILGGVPAVYLGGFPALWAAGRLRPGAVWVTATRIVDEHLGQRSEIALADVETVSPRSDTLHLTPREGRQVERRALVPRPWRSRSAGPALVIRTDGLSGGSQELGVEVQQHLRTSGS